MYGLEMLMCASSRLKRTVELWACGILSLVLLNFEGEGVSGGGVTCLDRLYSSVIQLLQAFMFIFMNTSKLMNLKSPVFKESLVH